MFLIFRGRSLTPWHQPCSLRNSRAVTILIVWSALKRPFSIFWVDEVNRLKNEMSVVIPLAFSMFAFQGHLHEGSLDTREASVDVRQVNRLRLLAQCRNNRVRRITCRGVASRGNLLAHSHNASCLQRQCARAYDVMMKVLRWLHRESKVCEMIRPCCLHRKAKSHTRLIPNCCAVRSKETHRLIHPRSSRVLKNTDKTSRAPRIPNTFAAERQHQTTGRLLQARASFQQSLPCLVFLTCSGRPVQSGTTRPASQCPFLKMTPEAQVP